MRGKSSRSDSSYKGTSTKLGCTFTAKKVKFDLDPFKPSDSFVLA